jgi:hypothetical protein
MKVWLGVCRLKRAKVVPADRGSRNGPLLAEVIVTVTAGHSLFPWHHVAEEPRVGDVIIDVSIFLGDIV